MAKPNYLAGMAYMLITSLFIEWNHFSAPLLINSLLIWIFYRVSILYNSNKPGAAIFNVGLIMGIVTLMYQPAIVFSIFLLDESVHHAPPAGAGMADRYIGYYYTLLFHGHRAVPLQSVGMEKAAAQYLLQPASHAFFHDCAGKHYLVNITSPLWKIQATQKDGGGHLFDSTYVYQNYPSQSDTASGLEINLVKGVEKGEYKLGINLSYETV